MSKVSHHQRFIPREEVVEVTTWAFAPMGRSAVEPEPEQAPELPPVDLEELHRQAYAEGFEQGRLAGAQETRLQLEAPFRQQLQEQARRLASLYEKSHADLAQLEDALAEQVLALACDLARQVVRRELAQSTDSLKTVVHEALSLAVQDGMPATVKLHPSDLQLLQTDLGEILAAQKIKLAADPHLTPGGCVVESSQGGVDATLEKRWSRAVANLGLNPPWNVEEASDA